MAPETARVLVLAVLLVTVGLAGCAADDGSQDDAEDPEDEAFTAEIPRWRIGNAWTYTIDTHGFPETETTMMVYDESADLYRIGSTDEEQALVHALFNVNPQLGRIQKGNLGVFEDGEPRAMYDFPMEDGDTWRTEFFISQHGGQLQAEATHSEAIDTPMGALEGFEIVAENDQGFRVEYDYVPEVRWFTKLVVQDSDGTVLHDLRLQSFEENATGTGYFVRGDDLGTWSFDGDNCGFPSGCTENVLVEGESAKGGEYGPYDLVAYNVQVDLSDPDNDRAQVEISDGDGEQVYSRQFLQSQESEFTFETTDDFAPGDWTIDAQVSGGSSVQVRLAGGWSYSGTVD